MSNLHQLIYVSSAQVEIGSAQLDSILAAARKNNERAGVTGLLIFHDNSFFQVLEGQKDELMRIFTSIEKDHRHSGVLLLQSKDTATRAFPNWSMGYVNAHALRPDQKAHLIDLRFLIGREEHTTLSSSSPVSVQINAFLDSFREFATA